MQQFLDQFKSFEKAVIDSSSVIYMQKSGFFDIFRRTVLLYTIPEVVQEIFNNSQGSLEKQGFLDSVEIIRPQAHQEAGILGGGIENGYSSDDDETVDKKVLKCALEQDFFLISEDKDILYAAKKQGLSYFNALVILHFLLFRGTIGFDEHKQYMSSLLNFARYSQEVLNQGQKINDTVRQYLRKES